MFLSSLVDHALVLIVTLIQATSIDYLLQIAGGSWTIKHKIHSSRLSEERAEFWMQSHDLRESRVHHPNMTNTFLQTAFRNAFMKLDDWY